MHQHMKENPIERPKGNKSSKSGNNTEEHLENDMSTPNKKKLKHRIGEKIYTVTVTYVEVPEEQRKIKRSIIEGILRKTYKKH